MLAWLWNYVRDHSQRRVGRLFAEAVRHFDLPVIAQHCLGKYISFSRFGGVARLAVAALRCAGHCTVGCKFYCLGCGFFLLDLLFVQHERSLLIWHPYLSNIFQLILQSTGASRYPLDIYRYTPIWITIFYLPFLLIVNIPLRALTGRLAMGDGLLFVCFCAGVFLLARWF